MCLLKGTKTSEEGQLRWSAVTFDVRAKCSILTLIYKLIILCVSKYCFICEFVTLRFLAQEENTINSIGKLENYQSHISDEVCQELSLVAVIVHILTTVKSSYIELPLPEKYDTNFSPAIIKPFNM